MPSASASRVLAALVVTGSSLGACGASSTTFHGGLRAAGVSSSAYVLATTDEAVALERDGSDLRLTHAVAGDEGWEVERCTGRGSELSTLAGYFCGAGGPSGHAWDAFLFGTAADSVDRVDVLDLEFAGGEVREGLWVVAISEANLPIGAVQWTGLASDGRVIASGDGVPGA